VAGNRDPQPAAPRKRSRRRASWPVWLLRSVGVAGVLLILLWLVATRSPLTRALVVPQFSQALGVPLTADRAFVGLDGRIVLRGVHIGIPELPGPEGDLLSVDKLIVMMDWAGLRATRVELRDPTVRLSQSVDDNTLNVELLRFFETSGAPADQLPAIVVNNASVELGEHDDKDYETLATLMLDGSLTPVGPAGAQAYSVKFAELTPQGKPEGPLRLSGRISPEEIRLTLAGMDLGRFGPDAVPRPIRELYGGLDLDGNVKQATFVHQFEKGFVLSLDLDSVDVTPPVQLAEDAPPIRMRDTDGSIAMSELGINAELEGRIEDLPYTVTFNYQGAGPNAAFDATFRTEDFALEKDPILLPQLPKVPKQHLLAFSAPTGVVDVTAHIHRGEPTPEGPAPIDVSGTLDFSDGWASFEDFPYPFENITGKVAFTDDSITLHEIRGVAESQATIVATGEIGPLTDDAGLDLRLHIEGAPVDDMMRTALGPRRREILDALFSEPALARLRAMELPVGAFEMGGLANVDVHVRRELGPDSIWSTEIDVRFPDVTMLFDAFPYPIRGRDVHIRMGATTAALVAGEFTSLGGAPIRMEATAQLPPQSEGEETLAFVPSATISARGLPIDDALVAALPDAAQLPDGRTLTQVLLELRPMGEADATLSVAPRADGSLGFDATVDLVNVALRPHGSEGECRLALDGATGRVTADERRASVALSGVARVPSSGARVGRVDLALDASYEGEDPPTLTCDVHAEGLNAKAPIEDVCAIFSPEVARSLATLRSQHNPDGILSFLTNVSVLDGNDPALRLTFGDPLDVSFDVLGGRLTLSNLSTPAVASFEGEPTLAFQHTEIDLAFNGQPVGRARASGALPIAALSALDASSEPVPFEGEHELRLSLVGMAVESPLVRALASRLEAEDLIDRLERAQVEGRFDAEILLTARHDPDPEVATFFASGEVFPRALRFSRPRGEVRVEVTGGPLTFSEDGARFEDLTLLAPTWSAAVDGAWSTDGESDVIDLRFSLEAARLGPDLWALLPVSIAEALDEIEFDAAGPVSIDRGAFTLTRAGLDQPLETRFRADVRMQEARADVGVPIERASGVASITAETSPNADIFDVQLRLERARALGIQLADVVARLTSGNTPGEILMPALSARCHEGRLTGFGHVRPFTADPARREYLLSVEGSGIRFHPVIADLRSTLEAEDEPEDDASPPDEASLMTGAVRLTGVVGEEGTRRGRGLIEVFGGQVLDLPLAVRVIEASNLALPVNDELDYARAEVFIEGPVVAFEELTAFSRTIGIIGSGVMTLPEAEVDLRFHTRATRRVPILSRLVESIRDELATTSVTGPVEDFQIKLVQFANPERALDQWLSARRLAQDILAGRDAGGNTDRVEPIGPTGPGK